MNKCIKYGLLYQLIIIYCTDSVCSSSSSSFSFSESQPQIISSSTASSPNAKYPILSPLSLTEVYEYTTWFRTVRPLRLLCEVCTVPSSSSSSLLNTTLLRTTLPSTSTVSSLLSSSLVSFIDMIQETETVHQRQTETLTNRRLIRITKAVKLLSASFRAYSTLYNETFGTNRDDTNTMIDNSDTHADRTLLEMEQLTYLNERFVHTLLQFRKEFPPLVKDYILQMEEKEGSSNLLTSMWNGLSALSTYTNRVQEYKEIIQQYGTATGNSIRQSKDYLSTINFSSESIGTLLHSWLGTYSTTSTVDPLNIDNLHQQINKVVTVIDLSVLMAIAYGFEYMNEDIQYCDQSIGSDNILIMKIAQRIFLTETVPSNECSQREFTKMYLVQIADRFESIGIQLFTVWKKILQPYAFSSLPRIIKKAMLSDLYQMDAEFTIALGEAYYQRKLVTPRDYLVPKDDTVIIHDAFRTKLIRDILNEITVIYRTLLQYSGTFFQDLANHPVGLDLEKNFSAIGDLKNYLVNLPVYLASLSTKSTKDTIAYLRSMNTVINSRAGSLSPLIWREYTCQGAYPKHNQDPFIAVAKTLSHIFQTVADILEWIEGQGQAIAEMDNSLHSVSVEYNGHQSSTHERSNGDGEGNVQSSVVTQSIQQYLPFVYEFMHGLGTIIATSVATE